MANLPDLNKSDIGIVAYWNGIDNTAASDISPAEVLTEGTIQSYSQYDNGVEGEVQVSYNGVGKMNRAISPPTY